jgi:hypothetical protein
MRRRPGRVRPSGPGRKSWTGFESPVNRCPGRGRPTSSRDLTPRKKASRWRLSNRRVRRTRPPRVGNMCRKRLPPRVRDIGRKRLPLRVRDMGRKILPPRLGDMGRRTSLPRATDLGCWTPESLRSGSIIGWPYWVGGKQSSVVASELGYLRAGLFCAAFRGLFRTRRI